MKRSIKLAMKRPRFLIAAGLLLSAVVIALVCVIMAWNKQPDSTSAISYTFDSDTAIITFSIEDGYFFTNVSVVEGRLSTPSYDTSTKSVSFDITEISLTQTQNEFIVLRCLSYDRTQEYQSTFEVIRQSETEVLIDRCYPNGSRDSNSIFYHPSPSPSTT